MVNWVRFSVTSVYGLVVFIFFILYLTNFIGTTDVPKDVLYVGFVIMIGIVLSMAASVSEGKTRLG